MRKCIWLGLLAVASSALAQTVERKFVLIAPRVNGEIVVDGKLDEPVWTSAPGHELAVNAHKESGRTVTKLAWDERGIYAGVVCHQHNVDALKAQVVSRDGGAVWADDSTELFFSPRLNAVNYYKFDVNSLGVFGDNYKEDAAQHHWQWNAMDARAASGRVPGAWTVEFFVSWKDMSFQPSEGGFVGFQQTRFEWSGAQLRPSYLTGGSYYTVRLAFVYLAGAAPPAPSELARQLDSLIPKPWFAATGDASGWFFSDKQSLLVEPPGPLIEKTSAKVAAALDIVEKACTPATPDMLIRTLTDLRKQLAETAGEKDHVKRLTATSALLGKTMRLKADLELDSLLNEP
ncbi:MAG: sugar-binding protein [Kiritimatiellae bacterium]|nr:sugar-binding protein [Kiritimatiellia bacterium]